MRRLLSSLFVFILLAGLLTGQDEVPMEFFSEYPDISSVSINGNIKVILVQGNQEGITFGNMASMEDTEITFKKGRLTIMRNRNSNADKEYPLYVLFKNLEKIYARGTSMLINTVKIEQENLNLYVSGGASVDLDMTLVNLRADLSGQALVTLKGRGVKETINTDGMAKFNGYNFQCESAYVKAESDSEVYVYVDKQLRTNGSPNIRYMGNPASVDGDNANRY